MVDLGDSGCIDNIDDLDLLSEEPEHSPREKKKYKNPYKKGYRENQVCANFVVSDAFHQDLVVVIFAVQVSVRCADMWWSTILT